jgi:hypothetical protein
LLAKILRVSTLEPGVPGSRQQPGQTAERRLTGWQRTHRWAAWLTFLGLAVWKSQRVTFSGIEWLALATGRASVGEVVKDIAVFIEGWIAETIARYAYDAELEKTHAYALFLLLIPGLIMVWLNLIPVLHRGSEFRVEADGSVMVRRSDSWEPLLEYQYPSRVADGRTIDFTARRR